MVSIVNGYVCFNCTDTEKAQKGVDPANPTNDPLQNKSVQQKKDAALALVKAEITKARHVGPTGSATSGQTGNGQSGTGQSSATTLSSLQALLPAGVGDVLDVSV
jgi:hypothetical protein